MKGKAWQMEYDGSIHLYPVQPGELWTCQRTTPKHGRLTGKLQLNSLYDGVPVFMQAADLLYMDPPWNLGNENSFRTKAGIEERSPSFNGFLDALFKGIDQVNPHTCFIEMGRGTADNVAGRLGARFNTIERWNITYYRKHPCVLLRGSNHGPTGEDYEGMDDVDTMAKVCARERFDCIGDLCMGRGGIAANAFVQFRNFVGCELNRNRLAVTIAKLARMGAEWKIEQQKVAKRES